MKEKIFSLLDIYCASMSTTTKSTYSSIVREWNIFLRGKPFLDAVIGDVWEYVFFLRNKIGMRSRVDGSTDFSDRTIKRNIDCLRGFYRYLGDVNLISSNPFDRKEFKFKIKNTSEKRPTEILPFLKVKKLLDTPDKKTKKGTRDRALLTAKFATGARVSEVCNLIISDIKMNPKGGYYLTIRRGKGNKMRVQTLPDWAMPDLLKLIEQRRKEGAKSQCFIFVGYGQIPENPGKAKLDRRHALRLFKKYAKRAGLDPNFSPHSARATAITKLLDDGVCHGKVKDFSGHASVQMVEFYDKRKNSIETSVGKILQYP